MSDIEEEFSDDDQGEEEPEGEDLGDEDDDEDDDEDYDDYDDDEYGGSRNKKKKPSHGGFIIDEADVDDDNEDDGIEGEDGYTDPSNIDDTSNLGGEDVHGARRLHNLWKEEKAEDIAEYFKRKYAAQESYPDGNYDTPEDIEQQGLLPSVKDPNLWMVRCRIGEEKQTVIALMRKALALENTENAIQIKSAVAPEGLKGYIYIEAYKQTHLKNAIEGFGALKMGVWKQQMVPISEMADVLKVVKDIVQVKPKSWVRCKRGIYKDDIAQVDFVNTTRNQVTIKMIPRIDYNQMRGAMKSVADQAEKRKRRRRPPQKWFDPDAIREIGGEITQDGDFFLFESNRYRNGFLYKNISMSGVIIEGVKPTLSELEKFETSIDDAELEISGKKKIEEEAMHSFAPGDNVEVIEGELIHLQGKILSIDGNTVTIMPKHEDLKDALEFPAHELRKHFKVGDHVKVIAGRYEGDTGLIIRVEENAVVLFSDLTMHELKAKQDDLQLCSDVSSGVDSLGQHQWGDLVQLDPQTVGAIVRLERETISVLNQHGKVVQMKPQAVSKRKDRNAVALDSEQNNIQVRDIVKVTDGPKSGLQGEIKHLYRGFAFISSKLVMENGGIFVAKAKNLVLAGGGKAATNSLGIISGGFAPMSPRSSPARDGGGGAGGAGRGRGMGRGTGRGFRDNSVIGQTVRIAKGPFKGYIGIVKDATESLARIELHTNCKTISVDRSRLAIVTGQNKGGGVTAYGHTPLYGAQTPMYGAQTPQHGSRTPMYGSQTPIHDGSRTPRYGSQTPIHDPSRTPLHDPSRTPSHDPSRTPSHDPSRTPSHDPSRTPSHVGHGGAWDPTQPNTPARPNEDFEYSFDAVNPSPSFGATPSPATPSGYVAPYTPGTPAHNIYGGDSYSPMQQTPSPMLGTPMTPGTGLMPQSPLTPGVPYEDTSMQKIEVCKDIEVKLHDDYEDQKFANKEGVIRQISGDTCSVFMYSERDTIPVNINSFEIVRPLKKDKVKILSGDHKDGTGVLINIDGIDGIIKMDTSDVLIILELKLLAKYIPTD